ncbi:uncharacterized protein YukE [Rhodococcus sp. 27YEA15]|uniref:TPR repeat region-containing protein n=1 Tax=Rhodococcus sp. 27YEA15 TaxID=3156259 RepID=UPI003C7BA95E
MTVTVSKARSWNTSALDAQAALWAAASESVDDQRRALSNRVSESPDFWRGRGADAMRQSADELGIDTVVLVSSLADTSEAARLGSADIAAARGHVLGCVAAAESAGFVVADDGAVTVPPDLYVWIVTEAGPDGADAAKAELERLAREHEQTIREALNGLEEADRSAASAVNAAAGNLRENPISGSAGTVLSGAQGGEDGDLVSSGEASDADLARISDALVQAQLTPEQLDAIARGERVDDLPQSTFDYVRNFYNEAGKGGLLDLADKLREQENSGDPLAAGRLDALANGLLTLSDEKVGTGTETGGYGQVPSDVRELVYHGYEPDSNGDRNSRDWADLNRLGELIGEATPGNQPGSELGVEFDRVAAHIADMSNQSSGTIGLTMPYGMDVERTAEQFLDVGTRNHESSSHILTGLDSNGNPLDFHRDSVIIPLLTHEWSDDGASAGALVDWINADAVVHNPDDPADVASATRAGESAYGLAQVLSTTESGNGGNNFGSLIDIAEGADRPGNLSMGQVNPALTQQIAGALAPYTGDIVGLDEKYTDTRGFGHLGPVEATRVFTLVDGDPLAGGILNGAALAQAAQIDGAFAVSAVKGDTDLSLGVSSGNLRGLVEAGLGSEVTDRNLNGEDADAAMRQQRSTAYGVSQWLASGAVSFIPGGAVVNPLANSVALMLQDDYVNNPAQFVGDTSGFSGESLAESSAGASNNRMYSMLSALVADGHVDPNMLNEELTEDGRLKTFDGMTQDLSSLDLTKQLPDVLMGAGVSATSRLDYLRVATEAGVGLDGIIYPHHFDARDSFNLVLLNGRGSENVNRWPS